MLRGQPHLRSVFYTTWDASSQQQYLSIKPSSITRRQVIFTFLCRNQGYPKRRHIFLRPHRAHTQICGFLTFILSSLSAVRCSTANGRIMSRQECTRERSLPCSRECISICLAGPEQTAKGLRTVGVSASTLTVCLSECRSGLIYIHIVFIRQDIRVMFK